MKKICSLLLFVVWPGISHSKRGPDLADSLLQQLPRLKDDTHKVKVLIDISFHYSNIDPDKGIHFGNEALELSESLGWQKGIAMANADLGINYEVKGDHAKALEYHGKALALNSKREDTLSMAGNLANISLVYMAQSSYSQMLENAFKALEIYERKGDKRNTAILLENIGTVYLEQKEYSKTMGYYSSALKAYKELNDRQSIARSFGNIGIVHDARGNYTQALQNHLKALEVNKTLGNKNSIQINLANVGYVYLHLKDHQRALEYQIKALKISEELKSKSSIAINSGNIGETYYAIATDTSASRAQGDLIFETRQANLLQAIRYLEQAVEICKEINYVAPLTEFSEYLSNAYAAAGNFEMALEVFKDRTALKDSFFAQQTKVQLAQLEGKRDLDIKERELQIARLKESNRQKERVGYISGILLLLLVMAIFARKFFRQVRTNKMLAHQKRMHLEHIETQKSILMD
ncbi:MAG TPA: tetratricopeptide repeat protein, partial [Flavipsychrobacter sp.]|nr:tetratricopeptide repeat protein [Flavipsychrobacter sp.]